MPARLPENFSPFSLREQLWRDFRGAYNDVKRVLDEITQFRDNAIKAVNALDQVAIYTVATLPSATSFPGGIVLVSDEVGGAVLAFSDGTNWRRVTDRAIVS